MHTTSSRGNRELWLAFLAIGLITLVYLAVSYLLKGFPHASSLFGHGIGILGFLLMLMTETLYTLRKRSRSARWGRMSAWLSFHIFTGIVGPYMVLLHSAWKFNGLAGVTMLLTVLIVASGFIGRYIYTLVPRSLDGAEMEAATLERELGLLSEELQKIGASNPELARSLSGGMASAVATRGPASWLPRLSWWWARRQMPAETRRSADQYTALLDRQVVLRRQAASLAITRRLLALWHTIHIPIGMALFTAAVIHTGAALYYATLLR